MGLDQELKSTSHLILASASPRRRELLESLGFELEIVPANVDESLRPQEEPDLYARRVARNKALAVASRLGLHGKTVDEGIGEQAGFAADESMSTWRQDFQGSRNRKGFVDTTAAQTVVGGEADFSPLVLAADTVVSIDGRVLGKPEGFEDFQLTMKTLSGNWHQVTTAVALWSRGKLRDVLVRTRVRFVQLSDAEIAWYWRTGEPLDKAGGYGLQGKGGAFVEEIAGSHSNVIGLPLRETLNLLLDAGAAIPWDSGSG